MEDIIQTDVILVKVCPYFIVYAMLHRHRTISFAGKNVLQQPPETQGIFH